VRGLAVLGTCLGALVLSAAGGCAPSGERERAPAPPGEVARFRLSSGPLEELRVHRDTAGALVVWGFCYFPEHTSLTVVVYDSSGAALARTQPAVQNSLFESLPLRPPAGAAWEPGSYEIEIHASFAPGAQPESVLRASRGGESLTGEGMARTLQGRPAYAKRFPVVLRADSA
jgi:hypothetical protein